ncbi:MAG TPA: tetratricopeptide repeat protein [Thermotogota bacterium]|nr:tetratricopeptide repeat protein [Thermotogota bacterium]HRW91637.1 tetratricopeptide repeat protein [Thermotogota bacterium]
MTEMAEFSGWQKRMEEANLLLNQGEVEEALRLFSELMEEKPEEPLVFYNMALAFLEKENLELAQKLFLHAVQLGMEHPNPWIGLGFCALKNMDFPGAIEHFTQALDLDAENPEALIGAAFSWIRSGQPEQARFYLEKLKSKNIWNQELALMYKTLPKLT